MYQAQDYHTMTGCVCMNLSWSIEWAILNRISLLLQSQTLSGLWTACLFTYGSEPLRICGMIFNNGCLLHFPPATQIQPKCFAPMKGIIFLKWHIKKKKKKKSVCCGRWIAQDTFKGAQLAQGWLLPRKQGCLYWDTSKAKWGKDSKLLLSLLGKKVLECHFS